MHSIMNKIRKFIVGAFVALAIATVGFVPMAASAAQPTTPIITPGTSYSNVAVSATITTDPVEEYCTVYTTDGSTPAAIVAGPVCTASGASQLYVAPFGVNGANGTSVQVKAISYDNAGIASAETSATYTFDTTAPIISGVTNGAFYNTNVTPTFADVSPLTITLNGSPYVQGTPIVANGSYALVATDSVGYSTTRTFTIDKIAPTVTVNGANPLTHEVMTPFSDPGISTFDANGVITTWTTGVFNPSVAGSYTVTYYAQDAAGNIGSATRVINVVDTTHPVVTGVTDGGYYNNNVTVNFSDTNNPTATLNGVPFASGTIVSAEGSYTLVVTDLAGNSTTVHFVIDKTVPVVAGIADGAYYNHNVTPTFTDLYLAGATLNGVPFASGTIVSAEGSYTLVVTDLAGNSTTVHFVIDKTVPVVAGIADGAYYNHNVTPTFTDLYLAGATLNGVPFASGTIVSAEGSYTLVVTDLAGNSTTVHFVIDKTNPTVAGVIDGSYYNYDVVITFDDLNLAGATLNGTPFLSGATVSAEGIYVLVVSDLAGNSVTITFVIDKTVPFVAGVTDGAYYNHDVTINYSDLYLAGATLNGAPFISGTVVTAEGSYTLVVTDLAGNVTTIHFVIDKTNPAVAGVLDGGYYNHDLTISYSDTNIAGATLNGVPFVSGTVVTAEGSYTLVVIDLAGNSTTVHFVIDKTVPVVAGVIDGGYYNHDVFVVFADLYLAGATLNGSPFSSGTWVTTEGAYVLDVWDLAGNHTIIHFVIDKTDPLVVGVIDGGYYNHPVTIGFSDTNLAGATLNGTPFAGGVVSVEGSYTLVVTDLAGNVVTIHFVIDLTDPLVTGVCDGCYYDHSVTIGFNDLYLGGATLNGVPFAGGVVSAEGAYILDVWDLAGNHTVINFVIDLTEPLVTGVCDGCYYNHSVTIGFSDTNLAGATLNGTPFAGGVVSVEGSYTLVVTDLAGNVTTIHFVIDLTDPLVVGVTDGAYYNHSVTIGFSDTNLANATLNGVPFAGGVVSAAGNYTLVVTDQAGNVTTIHFVIDYIAPTVGGVVDGGYYNHSVTVTFADAYPVSATLNGVAFVSGAVISAAGHYTLVVTDAAGNVTTIHFVIDYIAPVITLVGPNPYTIEVFNPYVDPGFVATDNEDGNITVSVVVTSVVNTNVLGVYLVTYTVTDRAGNVTVVTRTVRVVDTTKPVITLIGDSEIFLTAGTAYAENGATAVDNYDGNITSRIVISGHVDWNTPGVYTIVYTVTDSSGNTATIIRTVRVLAKKIVSTSVSGSGLSDTNAADKTAEEVKGTESGEIGSGINKEDSGKKDKENKKGGKSKLPLLALLALLLLIGAGLYLLYRQNPLLFGAKPKDDEEEKEE
jgi:uncharacterized lipoprotein NlpE involved in copper resistance